MDPVKAIKMLKGALTNIQKMKIEEQKKAVRSGYDMDILPTDIITYEKDTLELLDDLNSSSLVAAYPDIYRQTGQTEISKTYSMPKSYVSYRKPRNLSDEQREQTRKRMEKINSEVNY